jgi:hypothetical protein
MCASHQSISVSTHNQDVYRMDNIDFIEKVMKNVQTALEPPVLMKKCDIDHRHHCYIQEEQTRLFDILSTE